MQLKKVIIVGLGLIGGSLALRLKNKKNFYIYGWDKNKNVLNYALEKNIIQETLDFNNFPNVDFIIIATPINYISQIIEKIRKFNTNAIITDVGSVKNGVIDKFNFEKFVSCHPIAGSQKKSIKNADPKIFDDTNVILINSRYNKTSLKKLKAFWKSINVRAFYCDIKKHDYLISFTSHLPHIIASSLVSTVSGLHINQIKKFIGGSFRDCSRVATSDPKQWTEICFINRKNLSNAIERFIKILKNVKIILNDKEKLFNFFNKSTKLRKQIFK